MALASLTTIRYRRRHHCVFLLLLIFFVPPCSLAAPNEAALKHQKAIQLARDGQNDAALPLLRELRAAYPGRREYLHDYIAVLSWAERYQDALDQASQLRLPEIPAYVLESLGRAARGVGDPARAIEYYRMAVQRAPDQTDNIIGLAKSLSDQGQAKEALELLKPLLQRRPSDAAVLEALAYTYRNDQQWFEAIAAYDRLLAVQPEDREAHRQRILLTTRLGAAPLALDMARERPDLFSENELDGFAIDAATKYIRWNDLYHPLPAERFDDTDRAIALLQDALTRLEQRGEGDTPLAQRARYDLVVALRTRERLQDAIQLYEELPTSDTAIPDYVTQAAADAYLNTRQPERARDLYSELLQRRPDDFQLRMALFYTYFDLNQQERAYDIIDTLAAEQTDPDLQLRTARNAALARAWGEDLADAQNRYENLLRAAPNNPHLHADLGYVYLWRGWPRRALEQFRIGLAIEPGLLSARLGEIDALRTVNDLRSADILIDQVNDDYRDDVQTNPLRRSWEIHNQRELSIQAATTYSNGTQVGSRDLALDTHLYSRPQRIHYRVFAHDYFAQSTFPEGKGTYHRFGAGLEYRARDVELTGELSEGSRRDTGLGVALRGSWLADDHWRFNAHYDSYSNEAPLRGRLNEDIDGWSLGVGAEYRVHESRAYAADLQQLDFSDGNRRLIATASAFQRLIQRPRYKLDGRLGAYASNNTRDNASYYNPASDLSLDVSLLNEWLVNRRYSRVFLHRLGFSLGIYSASGFSSKPVGGVNYEHEWRLYDRLGLIYGLALSRPVYDGVYETHSRLYLNLRWRF